MAADRTVRVLVEVWRPDSQKLAWFYRMGTNKETEKLSPVVAARDHRPQKQRTMI
jgi:hypothetical protein